MAAAQASFEPDARPPVRLAIEKFQNDAGMVVEREGQVALASSERDKLSKLFPEYESGSVADPRPPP
jgi:hypothetical protein